MVTVKEWQVTVERDGCVHKFIVMAPTRRLALLNLRFGEEYFPYNYCVVKKIGLKRIG